MKWMHQMFSQLTCWPLLSVLVFRMQVCATCLKSSTSLCLTGMTRLWLFPLAILNTVSQLLSVYIVVFFSAVAIAECIESHSIWLCPVMTYLCIIDWMFISVHGFHEQCCQILVPVLPSATIRGRVHSRHKRCCQILIAVLPSATIRGDHRIINRSRKGWYVHE